MNAPAEKKPRGKGVVALVVIVSVCVLSVPCVGVLSAIAIPAFSGYLTRVKTAEATTNLNRLFIQAQNYYAGESWSAGTASRGCVVGSGRTSNVPGPGKTLLGPPGEPFESLGFALPDPVYFQYEIVSAGGCGHQPGEPIYSFRAYGDLDGDGITSLFEIAAAAGPGGELVRAPGIYRENELE